MDLLSYPHIWTLFIAKEVEKLHLEKMSVLGLAQIDPFLVAWILLVDSIARFALSNNTAL